LDERAKALDRQLVELGDAMVKQYGLGQEIPLEGVGVPRQEVICCIGRICNAVRCASVTALSCPIWCVLVSPFVTLTQGFRHFYCAGPRRTHQRHIRPVGRVAASFGWCTY
jgi:hypothetical protein